MAKISKYVKLDKDILLEYIYNDGNMIGDQYKILVDSRDNRRSYIAGDLSSTGNTNILSQENQLFKLDSVSGKYGIVRPDYYSYLQYKEFSSSIPVRHDTIKIHIPINWTFGEHLGFYIRVYTLDETNTNPFEISNFYFDMTNVSQQYLLNYSTPPLLFQEKLWGKTIQIEVPAVNEIAAQKVDGSAKPDSINYNLTNGIGLSITAPIFIDFLFIDGIQKINGISSYILAGKVTTTIPQTPEFERLGLIIKHSTEGDFFEVYGIYNNNIAEFKKFIDDSFTMGHRYYVQYNITTYEQNIRGKTTTVTVYDGFNETIEYRPIIKFSTTTAIIDVEMRLIDSVDDSYILRRASYGMLQDEVSKYSTNMLKINLVNASKPKIYNVKNAIDASLLGVTNAMGRTTTPRGRFNKNNPNGAGSGSGSGSGSGFTAYASSGAGFNVGIAVNKGDFGSGNAFGAGIGANGVAGAGNAAGSGFGSGLGAGAGSGFGAAGAGAGVAGDTGAGFGAGGGNGVGGAGAGAGAGVGNGAGGLFGSNGVQIQTIKVPYPVLIDKFNIIGKSENSIFNNNTFFGNAKMQIKIYPFDNIIKFIIASGDATKPDYLDMTGLGEIRLTFKNDNRTEEFPLMAESTDINLKLGHVVFKVPQNKVLSIKKIYESGVNIFYITAFSQGNNSVVYTGLYQIFDNLKNVSDLNKDSAAEGAKPSINPDPNLPKNTAVVTRKLITSQTAPTKKI